MEKTGSDGTDVNELTSQRLTDMGRAPSFYDVPGRSRKNGNASMKIRYRTALLASAAILAAALSGGCAQLGYYMQAAQGQYSLMAQALPIDDWLADPATGDKLKNQAQRSEEIRRFAAAELDLPDNGSYKLYADLKRSFVLWNVVAAPALVAGADQMVFPDCRLRQLPRLLQQGSGAGIRRRIAQARGSMCRLAASRPTRPWAGSTTRCCQPLSSTRMAKNWRAWSSTNWRTRSG